MSFSPENLDIPGYRMVRELGRGGMSRVYLAIQQSLDREVALKIMMHGDDAAEQRQQRFLREARTLARLGHRNIISVYDVQQRDDIVFMAMEYLPGGNLAQRMAKGISVAEAVSVIVQVAMALDVAHQNKVVHRDLKPDNVMFRSNGAPVVADFGIAHEVDSKAAGLTQVGTMLGTPSYMSPEQIQSEPLDGRSDQYSLGIVFYEMLTGNVPFRGDTSMSVLVKHLTDYAEPLPEQFRDFQPIIARMLAKAAEDRFPDCASFTAELRRVVTGSPQLWEQLSAQSDGSTSEQLRALGFSGVHSGLHELEGLTAGDASNPGTQDRPAEQAGNEDTASLKALLARPNVELAELVGAAVQVRERLSRGYGNELKDLLVLRITERIQLADTEARLKYGRLMLDSVRAVLGELVDFSAQDAALAKRKAELAPRRTPLPSTSGGQGSSSAASKPAATPPARQAAATNGPSTMLAEASSAAMATPASSDPVEVDPAATRKLPPVAERKPPDNAGGAAAAPHSKPPAASSRFPVRVIMLGSVAIVVLLGVLLALALRPTPQEPAQLVTSPAPPSADNAEQSAWQHAVTSGTDQAYRRYLAQWPDGEHAESARQFLETHTAAPAGTTPSIDDSTSGAETAVGETSDAASIDSERTLLAQMLLNQLGHTVSVSGMADTSTTAALRQFQADNALQTSGLADAATLSALHEAYRQRDEDDWAIATEADSEAEYQYYALTHPQGQYIEEASTRITRLQAQAQEEDDAAALEAEQARQRAAAQQRRRDAELAAQRQREQAAAEQARQQIIAVQTELRRLGREIEIDGLDGSELRLAISAFHRAAGSTDSDQINEKLLLALQDTARWPRSPGDTFRDCPGCPEMIVIPAGRFVMGSPGSEPERRSREGPQRNVSVASFALATTELTFAQWDACTADGGCTHRPDDRRWGRGRNPVIDVSWNDAQQYLRWLSERTGSSYRLPSEAEWEYAARAGTTGRFNTGDCLSSEVANYRAQGPTSGCPKGEYRRRPIEVASFLANAFGLYDMHGNVWEWTQDCWNETYQGAPSDASAWTAGDCSSAALRGGSWFHLDSWGRSAFRLKAGRDQRQNHSGFRPALSM